LLERSVIVVKESFSTLTRSSVITEEISKTDAHAP